MAEQRTTWLEACESHGFNQDTLESLILETQRACFVGDLPSELGFLRGFGRSAFVDLGFNNLSDQPGESFRLAKALAGTGIVVPGTSYRLRNFAGLRATVEAIDGSEAATLPDNWKQAVLVLAESGGFFWVGKLTCQSSSIDRDKYADVGDGWQLKSNESS